MPPPPPSLLAPPPPPPTSSQNQGQPQQQQPPWMQQAHAGKALEARDLLPPPPPPPPPATLSSVGSEASGQQQHQGQLSGATDGWKGSWLSPGDKKIGLGHNRSFCEEGMKEMIDFKTQTGGIGVPQQQNFLNSFNHGGGTNSGPIKRPYFEQEQKDYAQGFRPSMQHADQMRVVNSSQTGGGSCLMQGGLPRQIDRSNSIQRPGCPSNQQAKFNLRDMGRPRNFFNHQNNGCNLMFGRQVQDNRVRPNQKCLLHPSISQADQGPNQANGNYRWFAPQRN